MVRTVTGSAPNSASSASTSSQWRTGSVRVRRNDGGQGARSTAPPGPQSATSVPLDRGVEDPHGSPPADLSERVLRRPVPAGGCAPSRGPWQDSAVEVEGHEPIGPGPDEKGGQRLGPGEERRASALLEGGARRIKPGPHASSPPPGTGSTVWCRKPQIYACGLRCSNVVPSGRHAGTGDGWRGHIRFQTTSPSRQMRAAAMVTATADRVFGVRLF